MGWWENVYNLFNNSGRACGIIEMGEAGRDGKLEIGGRETVRVGVDEEAEREREERINKVEILRGFGLFM